MMMITTMAMRTVSWKVEQMIATICTSKGKFIYNIMLIIEQTPRLNKILTITYFYKRP